MFQPAGDIHAAMMALPMANLDAIVPGPALVLAPHPDDESIGCGALIAALAEAGRPPAVLCVTDGSASHPGSQQWPPERLARARQDELLAACALLGVPRARVECLGLPDGAAPHAGPAAEEAVAAIAAAAGRYGASVILSAWEHDPHGDHKACASMARRAAAQLGLPLLFYPVWGWLLPPGEMIEAKAPAGWRFDATPFLARKKAAVAAHATQNGGVITDSPDGFTLPPDLLAVAHRSFEVFLRA